MGQILQELQEKTDVWVYRNETLDRDYDEEWKKKFYEFVVLECIQVLRRRHMGDNNREDQEVKRCIEDIEKHFEVTYVQKRR